MPAAAPVRIVHLGVGNFYRAHAAWYTHHAPDARHGPEVLVKLPAKYLSIIAYPQG